jgi:dihydrofolate reductase
VRQLIVTAFMSLDGVMEAPGGEPGYRSSGWTFKDIEHVDEAYEIKGREMQEASAMLFGRVSYQAFAPVWPGIEDFAVVKDIPKYVVSTTLTDPSWQNTTVVNGDVKAELTKIKSTTRLGTTGSATLVRGLLEQGLIDELHLLVHPIVVGHGKKLFADGATVPLKLVDSTTFGTGVLHLVYANA